jgi:hypothetical protein
MLSKLGSSEADYRAPGTSTAARVAIADFLKFIEGLSHNNPPIDGIRGSEAILLK